MAPGKAYSLAGLKGASLSCSQGRLWLTLAGHVQDVVMGPGRILVLPDDGIVVVESDTGAILDLTAPDPAPAPAPCKSGRIGLRLPFWRTVWAPEGALQRRLSGR